jgi:hypothetical protein
LPALADLAFGKAGRDLFSEYVGAGQQVEGFFEELRFVGGLPVEFEQVAQFQLADGP